MLAERLSQRQIPLRELDGRHLKLKLGAVEGETTARSSGERILMRLQFHRAVDDMEIWSANGDGYSFVISFETPTGAGFRGRLGYVASWRAFDQRRCAIRVLGSPFQSLAEAEHACNIMLKYLNDQTDCVRPWKT
ncbi:hypothetical protein [Bradyrhizobium iriomotense]|uniref:Uncharacterized protein n=1 Tax=Bradyrhizobium iriomotense TaxID=441950 RepID=A0ABQ6BBA9_9BRAD|nr:hypothetical protein GCM10007857_78370 [Bradyrhizobium iriomotense]